MFNIVEISVTDNSILDKVITLDSIIFGELCTHWIDKIQKDLRILVIYDDLVIVAFMALYTYDEDTLHIWKTGVLTNYRCNGFLKALIIYTLGLGSCSKKNVTISTHPLNFRPMYDFLIKYSGIFVPFVRPKQKDGYVSFKWTYTQ